MDTRRLSTGNVLADGILNKPVPKTDIPLDLESIECNGDEMPDSTTLVVGLEAGKLLQASEYYGCAYGWKASATAYRGVLLQYRSVTEDKSFGTADECSVWFQSTVFAIAG